MPHELLPDDEIVIRHIPDPIPEDPGHALMVSAAASLADQPVRKQLAALFAFLT
jgi:hypothetical protein